MDFRLPKPKNWQDFESICHRLWIEIWNDYNAKKNGRQGQAQSGVDIYGKPIYSKHYSGVQCKDKDENLGSVLKNSELVKECDKAQKFIPPISTFTLATTASRDAKIQKKARELTSKKSYPFEVHVWAWDDIESEIKYRPSIMENFYPTFQISTEGQKCINLNRFSPTNHLAAYFSRPYVNNCLDSTDLKKYLVTLGYELSDNAYTHGKAQNFNINVESKKVEFTDDGIAFNPLKELDSTKASIKSNVGSFAFESFLKRYNENITPIYSRQKINGKDLNVLEFVLSDDFKPLDEKDFLELNIDWREIGGRDSAIKIASSIILNDNIKEIIWTITDEYYGFAMSFLSEFMDNLLKKMNPNQKLIISIPRSDIGLLDQLSHWFNDGRLIVKKR